MLSLGNLIRCHLFGKSVASFFRIFMTVGVGNNKKNCMQ